MDSIIYKLAGGNTVYAGCLSSGACAKGPGKGLAEPVALPQGLKAGLA